MKLGVGSSATGHRFTTTWCAPAARKARLMPTPPSPPRRSPPAGAAGGADNHLKAHLEPLDVVDLEQVIKVRILR